jgi:hypothetical protein
MALGHLGRTAGLIESFAEKSTEARQCALWYDAARQEVLEALDWPFARQRIALALHADEPPPDWGFRYQTPADLIAVRRVQGEVLSPDADAAPYTLESDFLGETVTVLTNEPFARMIYTRDAKLPQMFPPLFVNALAHYLAFKMALAVTGKAQIEQKEAQVYAAALRASAASSANQGVDLPSRDAPGVLARR